MVLPLLGGVLAVLGIVGLLGVTAVIVEWLALAAAVLAGLGVYQEIRNIDFGLDEAEVFVDAGVAAVLGFVTYKIFGAVLAITGLVGGLVVLGILLVGGVPLLRGGAAAAVSRLV